MSTLKTFYVVSLQLSLQHPYKVGLLDDDTPCGHWCRYTTPHHLRQIPHDQGRDRRDLDTVDINTTVRNVTRFISHVR